MIKNGEIKFGDIVWTEFDPSVGHEYKNKRPAIVIQSDEMIKKSNLITIIPLTSNKQNVNIDDIVINTDSDNKLKFDSIAKVYCITSFDYQRFDKIIGNLNNTQITEIKSYLLRHFGI